MHLEYLHNFFILVFAFVITKQNTFYVTFTTLATSAFTRVCTCLTYIIKL